MSTPRLSNSPTLQLAVGSDRKLRADALVSPAVLNALEVRSDGLFVEQFTPDGALLAVTLNAATQVFPVYPVTATPSPDPVRYDLVQADTNGMTDPADLTRLTIKKAGKYLVTANGRWVAQGIGGAAGTWAPMWAWAWLTMNGNENLPVALHINSGEGSPAVAPSLTGSTPGIVTDTTDGSYVLRQVVDCYVGDYFQCLLMFQDVSGTPDVEIIRGNGTTITALFGAVQVGV